MGIMETKKEETHPVFSTRMRVDLIQRVKVHCAKKGILVQEFIAEAVEKNLKKT